MPESDEEILEDAKRLRDRFGSDALMVADKSLQDVIPQKDAEAISYWREIIKALSRLQP